jgi:hypothetical protein
MIKITRSIYKLTLRLVASSQNHSVRRSGATFSALMRRMVLLPSRRPSPLPSHTSSPEHEDPLCQECCDPQIDHHN